MATFSFLVLSLAGVDGGGEPPARVGRVVWDFAQPSEWVAIRGRIGLERIVKGTVRFKPGGEMEMYWKLGPEAGDVECTKTRRYTLDPASGLPRFPAVSEVAALCGVRQPVVELVGDRLEVSLLEGGFKRGEAEERLYLVLVRAK
jgi:hypothetical protein